MRTSGGDVYECKLKGSLRMRGSRSTNPAVVGDNVVFEPGTKETPGRISAILPRNNYIARKATKLSKASHVIAANIDQAFVIATLAQPRTSTGFIDRFLVTSEAYHIPGRIVFNKIDLYDPPLLETLENYTGIYNAAGYPCFKVSAKTGEGIDTLADALKGNVNLLAGHSGVGKSEIINSIRPGLNLKTRQISGYHEKGLHTTTFTEMFPLSFGGYIIDTPGIKEFGLFDFSRKEIPERFPEFRKYLHQCRFRNCTHLHEPGCAVKKALAEGEISSMRYENYLSILNDDYWKATESDFS